MPAGDCGFFCAFRVVRYNGAVMRQRKNIFIGLSGGVDSSVSAALLVRAGYRVTGAFIKAWYPDFLPCSWREERLDAMRVCATLGIPFVTIDLEAEYKRAVIDYFVREYAVGRTPNPDVVCNREIKFGTFLSRAAALGADLIATGHYARTEQTDGRHLLRGIDSGKDQSYFLWAVPEAALEKTLFPVGGYLKSDVRKLARSFGLPTAAKKDSQGLCFLGHIDVREFLSHYLDVRPGNVRDGAGEIIGEHDGALLYTVGQRHGFRVRARGESSVPRYVLTTDVVKNEITVGETPHAQSYSPGGGTLTAEDAHWIGPPPAIGSTVFCSVRYRDRGRPGSVVSMEGDSFSVKVEGLVAVAPGQSIVLYDGDRCLGGGTASVSSA